MGGTNARGQQRKRTLISGKLVSGDGVNAFDCFIIDFSDTGARVRVSEYGDIPEKVFLVHPQKRTAYRATVAWRRGDTLGLKLAKVYDLRETTPAELKPLRFYR